jgi:hypothetical protein
MFEELESIMLDQHGEDLRRISAALWRYIGEDRLERAEWLLDALVVIAKAGQKELKKRGR